MNPDDLLVRADAISADRMYDSSKALRWLDRAFRTVVDPLLEQARRHHEELTDDLLAFVKHLVKSEKQFIEEAERPLESSMANLDRRLRRMRRLERRAHWKRLLLGGPEPPGDEVEAVVHTNEVAGAALELGVRIASSHVRVMSLLPTVEKAQASLDAAEKKHLRALFSLVGGSLRAPLPGVLTVLALLGLTLVLDRFTPLLEAVARTANMTDAHDVVLLGLFAVELAVLGPIVSRISDGIRWSVFERNLKLMREILATVQGVEVQQRKVKARLRALSSPARVRGEAVSQDQSS